MKQWSDVSGVGESELLKCAMDAPLIWGTSDERAKDFREPLGLPLDWKSLLSRAYVFPKKDVLVGRLEETSRSYYYVPEKRFVNIQRSENR